VYLEALETRQRFIRQLDAAMASAGVDALVVPAAPIAAPLIGEERTPINGQDHPTRALLLRLNRPANLAGIPAISVPCGFTRSGLPVGLQLIGRADTEATLLRIAHTYERAHPSHRRPAVG
jgi:aspartyl-tRNA(Asn)/glutamyl-tRNA(Gln) amidotransferase subunit A